VEKTALKSGDSVYRNRMQNTMTFSRRFRKGTRNNIATCRSHRR